MTFHPERRAPVKAGTKRRVWPPWLRAAYRVLNTAMGMRAARLVVAALVFGVLLGGILYWTVKQIESDRVQILENKVDQVQDDKAETDRRLKHVEEVIAPIAK